MAQVELTQTYTDRDSRVDGLVKFAEQVRQTLAECNITLPATDIIREAISGMLHSRTGRLLAKAPNFRERPLASILYRLGAWHGSNGYIGSLYSISWDCRDIAKTRPDLGTGRELNDRLDTLALVLRGGASPAIDKWAAVLGRYQTKAHDQLGRMSHP